MAQPRKPKGMLPDQRLSACRRTVDMVGKFTFMTTTTTFEDVINPDHTKTVEDQSPSQAAYLVFPQEATSDAVEPETGGIEGISNNLTVPTTIATTTTTMQENQHVDTIADRRSYRVAFLTNRAELGSYSTSTREKETSVATWLSQVRRRCLNIRNWMPKMCSCVDNNPAFSGRAAARIGNYQRLGSRANDSGFHRQQPTPGTSYDDDTDEYYDETADEDANNAEQLSFYFDDGTCNTLLVEKNLRAIDLCQLLKVKRNVRGIFWSIMETWPEVGIERTLEDHEAILAVYKEMKLFTPRHVRKFIFRADLLKYQLFHKHRQEFIAENPVISVVNGPGETAGKLFDAGSALRRLLRNISDQSAARRCRMPANIQFGLGTEPILQHVDESLLGVTRSEPLLLRGARECTKTATVWIFPRRSLASASILAAGSVLTSASTSVSPSPSSSSSSWWFGAINIPPANSFGRFCNVM